MYISKHYIIVIIGILYLRSSTTSPNFKADKLSYHHGLVDYHENGRSLLKRRVAEPCKDGQFQCNSEECISNNVACDGTKDCKDGSDETLDVCGDIKCPGYNFQCAYGACIDVNLKCNGRADCVDNSDELPIRCPILVSRPNVTSRCRTMEQFKCKSGTCIKANLLCNGIKDCDDGSDESIAQCENIKCPTYTFRCNYGACIEGDNVRCDGIKQCPDGSDEADALCRPNSVSVKPVTPTPPPPSSAPDSCHLPQSSDKTYSVTDDMDRKIKVGSSAPKQSKLTATCAKGYSLPENKKSYISVCYSKGAWIPPLVSCIKTCSPLKPVNVELKCFHKDTPVDCNGELLAGTIVRPQCKALYHPAQDPLYKIINCQENGVWDQTLYTCTAECGLRSTAVNLISKGKTEKLGDSPWHVAIYYIPEQFSLICGGTLIHPQIVVSAAHCFYNPQDGTAVNKTTDYEIMVSKLTRDYNKKDKETQQKVQVKEIVFSERGYNPKIANHYGSDIIIIILKRPVIISPFVLPACLDTAGPDNFNPGDGVHGKVVGWGYTANGSLANELQAAEIPYINYQNCLIMKIQQVSNDKFCAGSQKGPGARVGDSGGGLMFKNSRNGLYYLRGVVSTKNQDDSSIATFTDVAVYMEWIVQVRNRVDQEVLHNETTLDPKS